MRLRQDQKQGIRPRMNANERESNTFLGRFSRDECSGALEKPSQIWACLPFASIRVHSRLIVLALLCGLAAGGDVKPLPGQAGNDDIELVASVIIDRGEVTQAIGEDLGAGYIAVRMKVTPKTEKPLRISPDDFTIICRKDGQRSVALSPGQIAGTGALVVKPAANQPGGLGTATNGPVWGGVGMGTSRGAGNSASGDRGVETKIDNENNKGGKGKDNPLLAALKAKVLADKESLEPIEGLLYFPIEGKVKPKDLAITYKGPAGRLVMEFANPK
jgi:hypothetical protein